MIYQFHLPHRKAAIVRLLFTFNKIQQSLRMCQWLAKAHHGDMRRFGRIPFIVHFSRTLPPRS